MLNKDDKVFMLISQQLNNQLIKNSKSILIKNNFIFVTVIFSQQKICKCDYNI